MIRPGSTAPRTEDIHRPKHLCTTDTQSAHVHVHYGDTEETISAAIVHLLAQLAASDENTSRPISSAQPQQETDP